MTTMEEKEKYAVKIQKIHCELLNGSLFDLIPKEKLSSLKEIFLHYFPESAAVELSGKFFQRQMDLKFGIILVNCLTDDKVFTTAVVKVLEQDSVIFYDAHCRRYKEWENYLSSNMLPKCLMIYPKNGMYKTVGERVYLEKKKSPAESVLRQMDEVLIVGAECVSLISLVVPMFSFAKPFTPHIKIASGIANGYKIGHHSHKLYDRFLHDRPYSFKDKKAVHHWFHIGNGFLSFSFTWLQCEYGKTIECSSTKDIMNAASFLKSLMCQDSLEAINTVRGHILCHYMLQFSETAAQKLPQVLGLSSDQSEIFSKVFNYLINYLDPNRNVIFRRLLFVNAEDLNKVTKDLKTEFTVPEVVNNKMYEILFMYADLVDSIMNEINVWKNGEISDKQLKFRVTEICHEGKKYETIAEMCKYYKVGCLDEIEVNGRRVFRVIESRHFELEEIIENASGRYPQLLMYAVEYASKNNEILDWNGFKPYFVERINKEALSELQVNGRGNGIHWMYTLNKKEVNFSLQCNENTIDFVSPKNTSHCSVSVQDLVILCKRLLGTLFEFDVSVANDQLDWVVVVSKKKKKVIILGPSFVIECPMRTYTHPLWIRSF